MAAKTETESHDIIMARRIYKLATGFKMQLRKYEEHITGRPSEVSMTISSVKMDIEALEYAYKKITGEDIDYERQRV